MANIVIPGSTFFPAMNGAIPLKAAGLVAASAAHTSVVVGHAAFCIELDWTACEIDTGNEHYHITVEVEDASGTWTQVGVLADIGATASVASEGDAPATGNIKAGFRNPFKGQGSHVRLHTWVSGTVATGINFSANLFPIDNLNY